MKKRLLLFVSCLLTTLVVGCNKPGTDEKEGLYYPSEGFADDSSDSWNQLDKDAEELTVNWFVNMASYGNAASKGTMVAEKIYEKTKCRINFIMPITDDGAQLSTMIAGDKLPDVITVGCGSEEATQLADEGYAYPIQTLASKYAPSLLNRLSPDIANFFKRSDGNIYGMPNHFYTQADLEAYQTQEGTNLNPNGTMLCREDWLKEYTRLYPSKDVTKASGFLEMCKWVKQKKNLPDTNPTFLLDKFSSKGSDGITFLMEYFAVPSEGKDGQLLISREQPQYSEALMWLNELYREKIISDSNFSATYGTIAAYLQQGMAFAFVGSPQLYTGSIGAAYKSGINYVPIVITNENGDVPQLRDLSGPGWLFNMITKGCKHPDRVIKLFDYLYSDEGQSLFFGIENETFTYEIRPGETVDGKTYKYGRVQWAEETEKDIIKGDTAKYGFMYSNPFVNPMYPRLASPDGAVLNSYNDYIDYNMKVAISDYAYNAIGFDYRTDVSDPQYKDIFFKSEQISDEWATYIPQIITATTAQEAKAIYDATVASARRLGSQEVLEFDNRYFQAYKTQMNIAFAWPPNDPNSSYQNLVVDNIRGNVSYNLTIPQKFLDD